MKLNGLFAALAYVKIILFTNIEQKNTRDYRVTGYVSDVLKFCAGALKTPIIARNGGVCLLIENGPHIVTAKETKAFRKAAVKKKEMSGEQVSIFVFFSTTQKQCMFVMVVNILFGLIM